MDGFTRSLAVLVAIDNYENGVPVLRTPVSDAEELANVLRRDQGFEAEVWRDQQATLEGLRRLLADLPKRVSNNDRVIFYFAGHGIAVESADGPEGYLLPQDAERNSIDKFLPMLELQASLEALPCRHMLIVLDCCFAGAFRWASYRQLGLSPQKLHRERYQWFIQDRAWQAIASAAHDQKALDVAGEQPLGKRDTAQEHSPFASALMRGLQGAADWAAPGGTGDGVITATELYLYLEHELLPKSGDGPRQTPIFWPLKKHDKGEFVFLVPGHKLALPDAPPLNTDANPWRALDVYETRHKDLFYGRTEASKALLAQVLGLDDPKYSDVDASKRFVVVTGPSGIGKSSLVRAGLLPRLREVLGPGFLPIVTRPSRPGPDIFGSLADELRKHSLQDQLTPTAHVLRTDPGALSRWCRSQEGHPEILIVVDQAEELYTHPDDPEQTAADFLQLIQQFIYDGNTKARVIFTVRSEFEPQFSASALRAVWPGARYLVPAMTQDELRRVIEGPAAVQVLRFEPAELVDTLVNEVVSMPGGLPILSFALSQMYLNYLARRATDRVIAPIDYASLQGGEARDAGDSAALKGGITTALRVRADNVLGSLDEVSRITARRILERLVSVESGQFARRRVPRKELSAEEIAEAKRTKAVLELFDDARLIVTDNVAGEPYLELAHDALIVGWPRLLSWVRLDAPRISALRRLTIDTTQWEHASRQVKGLLWSDAARSVIAQDLLSAEYPGVNSVEREFAQASIRRSKRNRQLRTTVLVGLLSLSMIAASIAILYGVGVRQAEIDHLLSTARAFQSSGDPARAYAFSLAALEESRGFRLLWGDRSTTAEGLLNALINSGVPQVYPLFQTTFSVSLTDKGTFIAAIGKTDVDPVNQNRLMIGAPNHPDNTIAKGQFMTGVFRPAYEEYYSASFVDRHVMIEAIDPQSGRSINQFSIPEFESATRQRPGERPTLMLKATLVDELAFSADGNTLLVAGWAAPDPDGLLASPWRAYINVENGMMKQYALSDEKIDLPYAAHTQHIASSEDGSRVVSSGISSIYLDDLPHSTRVIVGSHSHGALFDVAISPSGKRILSGGASSALTLFSEMPDGSWTSSGLSLPGDADVELLRFASEDLIVASRSDYTINVARIQFNQQPTNNINPGILRAGDKGQEEVSQQPVLANTVTLRGHSGKIHTLLVDRTHARIFSGGEDREIRVWGLETGERRILRGSERAIEGLVLSRSADWLLSWDLGGAILAWHLPEGVSAAYSKRFPRKDFEDRIETDSYLGAGDGGSLTAFVNRKDSHLIEGLGIAAEGRLVVVGYYGGPILVWNSVSNKAQTIDTREGAFHLTKDGKYLIVTDTVMDKSTWNATEVGQVLKASEGFTRIYTTSIPAVLDGDQWVTVQKGRPVLHPLANTAVPKSQNVETYVDTDEVRRFSPNGRWFVSLDKRRYCFWQSPFLNTGTCGRTPSPWFFGKSDIVFEPNRDQVLTLASGKNGNRLIEINLAQEQVTVLDSGELASTFKLSEDGSYIAAAGRFGELYFGNAESYHLREVGRHSRQVLSMAFSDDGRWIATGGLDRVVKVWSTSTFDSVQYEFLNPIQAIVFDKSMDRWLVASGGSVFSVHLLESTSWNPTGRFGGVSNLRVDQKDRSLTVTRAVELASLQ